MSVVAWDGQTLAADRRAVYQNLARTTRKIFRLDANRLVGFAGEIGAGLEMVQWLKGGARPKTFPAAQRDEKSWVPVVVVVRGGEIKMYERTPYPARVLDSKYAIGSGRDFALAAMYLQRSAREAVEITCEFDTSCGNGIDVLEFE